LPKILKNAASPPQAINAYAMMHTFSFPCPQSTVQSSIEKHWANMAKDVTLFDPTLDIKRPASMHRSIFRRVNRPQQSSVRL